MEKILKIFSITLFIIVVVSTSGCFEGPPMSYEKDSDADGLFDSTEIELGTDPQNADSDGDGMGDGEEVINKRDPLATDNNGDSIIDDLQLYGKSIYFVGPTMGAYGEDGFATYMWTFSDQNGYKPSERKFACVTPTELPDEFWGRYDTREALMEQDWIDKKADNLYIPFDEDGMISFSLNTYRIQGKYGFKICGILDEDYIDEKSYAGDGDEVVVEVAEPIEVSGLSRECEEIGIPGKPWDAKCYVGKWHLFDDESDIVPLSEIGFSYSRITAPDGREYSALFLLSEKRTMVEGHPYLPYQYEGVIEIYRWSTILGDCGQFGHAGKCGYGEDGILYYTICLQPWETVTLSILKADEVWFTYSGTGDPIVITYPSEDEPVTIAYPD